MIFLSGSARPTCRMFCIASTKNHPQADLPQLRMHLVARGAASYRGLIATEFIALIRLQAGSYSVL